MFYVKKTEKQQLQLASEYLIKRFVMETNERFEELSDGHLI